MFRFASTAPDPAFPPARETGEAYVFRDFERSRIMAIRRAVERQPALYACWFFGVVAVWTILISAGTAAHGMNTVSVNLTPHVAHFTIILGIFFYPLRLVWVPLLAYLAVFLYPFYQPFGAGPAWIALPGMTPGIMAALFGLNLTSGLVLGQLYRLCFLIARPRLRAHAADLLMSCMAYLLFAVVGAAQIALTQLYAQTLPAPVQAMLGFDSHYAELALNRTLRGCAVVAVFLLATVEYPRRNQIAPAVAVSAVFVALAGLQAQGFAFYPMLDAVLVGLLTVFALPIRVALPGVVGGMAAFAALTGEFLNDHLPDDPATLLLERYSILGLAILVVAMALKSHTGHLLGQKDAAIRKLNRARVFAGVGLFAVNRATGRFRLDDAGSRMLHLPAEGATPMLMAALLAEDAAALAQAMQPGEAPARELLLRAGSGAVLRGFVWAEASPIGDPVAYGIVLDVTEAEQRAERLREALAELSTRQERQRQLFSIVSHELRTPASVLSLLIDDLDGAAPDPRSLRQLREAADQLMSVLGDMRQAVNPEQNLPLRQLALVPAELAESLKNGFELMARDKGMRLVLQLGAGAGRARMVDMRRLRQALSNVMRNALIHSGGRRVTLRFDEIAGPDGARLSRWQVEDDGVGIDEAEIERLFQPFERGRPDPRRSADGSGLGLYIARQSIEMLGGTLRHYRPEGGGAGYVIELPDAPDAPAAPEVAVPAPAAPDRAFGVVLAEDNELVADVTKARLERLGAKVRVARDGRAALALVTEAQPDLVITDLFMPELDGDDLIRRLRAGGFERPVIGLTAAVVGDDMDRFRLAGANLVMQKPLDFSELARLMRDGFPDPAPDASLRA